MSPQSKPRSELEFNMALKKAAPSVNAICGLTAEDSAPPAAGLESTIHAKARPAPEGVSTAHSVKGGAGRKFCLLAKLCFSFISQ